MILLTLFIAAAFASGPPVDTDPEDCIANNGYLAGSSYPDGDCCSFVVCDAARLNKTGFIGKCMGGTVWNDDLKTCDDPKYVEPPCDPANDCDVPSRTTGLCAAPQPTASTCCIGQNVNRGEPGYLPVFTLGENDNEYSVGDGPVQQCPFGQTFKLDSCCCEYEYEFVSPCDDTTSFFFSNQDEECCSFVQCWANRTGYDVVQCMPPSVWNDVNKTCDSIYSVMECMDIDCGAETTDPPCDEGNPAACCRAGVYYNAFGDDPAQYEIADGPFGPSDRFLCCPEDMNGVQMVFNDDPDVCACEVPEN